MCSAKLYLFRSLVDMLKVACHSQIICLCCMTHITHCFTVLISIFLAFVKLATIVEGNPKAPFSIATTPRCRGGRYSCFFFLNSISHVSLSFISHDTRQTRNSYLLLGKYTINYGRESLVFTAIPPTSSSIVAKQNKTRGLPISFSVPIQNKSKKA